MLPSKKLLAFCLSDMLPSEFYVGSRVLINFYKHIFPVGMGKLLTLNT